MNRRGFFRRLGLAVAAVTSGICLLPQVKKIAKQVTFDNFPTDFVLGYKGSAFLETGVVYAPYIPLVQTCHLVNNPEFAKRYAESTINQRYYSKETICA